MSHRSVFLGFVVALAASAFVAFAAQGGLAGGRVRAQARHRPRLGEEARDRAAAVGVAARLPFTRPVCSMARGAWSRTP